MKKNSLRSAIGALAVAAVSVTAASMNAFAAPEAASLGFTAEQIANSATKPYVTLTKTVLTLDEVKANNYVVRVNMNVTGAAKQYAATGFHVHYDNRMQVAIDDFTEDLAIYSGAAISRISPGGPVDDPTAAEQGMAGFFVCSSGNANYGNDGSMWDIDMILPQDTAEGDVFPLDIYYIESKTNEDLFVNVEKDTAGNLMQAWTFTQGIYNELWNPNFAADPDDVARCAALADINNTYDGYIAIEDAPPVTTTTTTEAPIVTTTTTTEAPIVPETTTTTEAPVPGTTTTTTVSTAKPVTKPATTAKPAVTTKPAGNAPKTGVAGVGVAAAGLAVALGTAFVLRKKED